MMVACLYPFIATSPHQSVNRIHQELASWNQVPAMTTFSAQAQLLTFPWTLLFHHNTSSNLTMVLPNPSQLPKWFHSFQNHGICHPIPLIFFLPSFVSIPRSRLSTRVNIIRGIFQKLQMVLTVSATNHTSTRNNPIGRFLCPISHQPGKNCAWMVF